MHENTTKGGSYGTYYTGCKQLAPLQTNDHCAILLPAVSRTQSSQYESILSKVAITDHIQFRQHRGKGWPSWLPTEKRMCSYWETQYYVTNYQKAFTSKTKSTQKQKPIVKIPEQITIKTAHQKRALLSQTNNTINNTIKGTKTWWKNLKKLIGGQNSNKAYPTIFINNNWLSNEEFCEKLSVQYFSGNTSGWNSHVCK